MCNKLFFLILSISYFSFQLYGEEISPENNSSIVKPIENDNSVNKFAVKNESGKLKFYLNNEEFYINGIGGRSQLDLAKSLGANAFRIWDTDVKKLSKELDAARKNNMYALTGIWLSHHADDYLDETYKNKQRNKLQSLLDAYKNHPNIMAWALGNEINLEGADTKEAWEFVNELAVMIKKQDSNHPVMSVISYSETALNNIAKYAPDLDLIGINAYGAIYNLKEMVAKSQYEGVYAVTEWGPSGHWETKETEWGAPIEQTSEEKRIEYEKRYQTCIKDDDRCLGSFVFLWGQKQERTPTWYGMFVESDVEELPLRREICPTVEVMEKAWKGTVSIERAPVVKGIILKEKDVNSQMIFKPNVQILAFVDAFDPKNYELTYVWEMLEEATVLGNGGSYEPRPKRIGKVITGKQQEQQITIPVKQGNYRLYVYVLNGKGMVGTSNIPFRVTN